MPHVWPLAGFRFVEGESVTVGRYGRRVTPVYSVMRKVNADCAGMNVHLSSMALTSLDRAYHKIRGSVKKHASTAISWGRARPTGSAKRTIYKLPHQFRRSLLHNDFFIVDLNSTNATYINGEKLIPQQGYSLRSGDIIELGKYRMAFTWI